MAVRLDNRTASITAGTPAISTDQSRARAVTDDLLKPFFTPAFMYVMFAMVVVRRIYGPLPQFIASDLGVTVAIVAQTLTVETILSVIAALVVSPLADTIGRRPVILVAIVLRTAGAAMVWVFPNLAVLFLAAALLGIGNGIVFPQIFSSIGDLFEGQRRDRLLATMLVVGRFAFLAGPLISGFLAGAFDWSAAYAAGAVLSGLALAVAWYVAPRLPTRGGSLGTVLGTVLGANRSLLGRRTVSTLLLANVVFVIGGYGIEVFFGAFVAISYGLAAEQVGLLLTIGPAMAMFSTYLSGRIPARRRSLSLVASGLIFFLPVTILLNLPLTPLFAIAMSALWSFGLGLRSTSLNALLLDLAPENRGAIAGLMQVSFSSGIMLGSALGGIALILGGYELMGIFFGACTLISSAMFVVAWRAMTATDR